MAVRPIVRAQILSLLARYPQFRAPAQQGYFAVWKGRVALESRLRGVRISPSRVLDMNPAKITHAGVGWDCRRAASRGSAVQGGNWDLSVLPFDHLDVFQSVAARFADGIARRPEDEQILAGLARRGANRTAQSAKDDGHSH